MSFHQNHPSQHPVWVSMPTLNFLIIVVTTFTNHKIYFCDNCPTLGQRLTSQLRLVIKNPTLTQVLPPFSNHLAAHTVKRLSNPRPKSHHLDSFLKNHMHKRPKNTSTQSLLLPNLQIYLVLLDTSRPPYPAFSNPIYTYQIQAQILQTQAQQHQMNTQTFLPLLTQHFNHLY